MDREVGRGRGAVEQRRHRGAVGALRRGRLLWGGGGGGRAALAGTGALGGPRAQRAPAAVHARGLLDGAQHHSGGPAPHRRVGAQ